MKKSIFDVTVNLHGDYQSYLRLIDACKNSGLKTDKVISKAYSDKTKRWFHNNNGDSFGDWILNLDCKTIVTESEFLELLKEHKDGK